MGKRRGLSLTILVGPGGRVLFEGGGSRTVAMLSRTLSERGDPNAIFSAELPVDLAGKVQ